MDQETQIFGAREPLSQGTWPSMFVVDEETQLFGYERTT